MLDCNDIPNNPIRNLAINAAYANCDLNFKQILDLIREGKIHLPNGCTDIRFAAMIRSVQKEHLDGL